MCEPFNTYMFEGGAALVAPPFYRVCGRRRARLQEFSCWRAVCVQEGTSGSASNSACAVCVQEGILLGANGTSALSRTSRGALLDANGTRNDRARARALFSELAPHNRRVLAANWLEPDPGLGGEGGVHAKHPLETVGLELGNLRVGGAGVGDKHVNLVGRRKLEA